MGPDEAGGVAATETLPLIPRAAFFGNPAKAGGQISPDGRWLSWLAARNGVLNVWVAPEETPEAARALTDEAARPVAGYLWSADGAMVLYITDPGGHENLALFGVDPATGDRRTLAQFDNARVQAPKLSRRIAERVLIQANNRDPSYFDVLMLDLKTGALTTIFENRHGFGEFLADEALELRLATKALPSGDVELYRIDGGKAAAEPFDRIPFEDVSTTGPIGYSYDGATLYWRDSRGRDTAALFAEDVATGARTLLAEDARADLGEMLFDPTSGRAQAYTTNYLRPEWTALDPAVAADLTFLRGRFAGEVTSASRTSADDKWVITVAAADAPAEAWLYQRATKAVTRLYATRPELEGQPLAPMLPFEIPSRDGWTLVSYLTLPPGSDPGGHGRPASSLPMVLFVHGGPWSRDLYGYNSVHQWLANRGYAVLSVNFRASTGLGKAFCSAGDCEWGAKMQDDLLDAVDWAVARGVTANDRAAIFGGSYGGYATLAALTFTPEAFVCGVDLFGPSNLNTLLATTPSYWASMLSMLHRRVGDPATPEGQALLKARSPAFAADAIVRPLLIAQGANDARVKQAESDQIVEAMQAKAIPVTYLLFDDEGHGFARPDNNLAFFAATELFLAQHLGGRAEPMPASLPNATMRILEGGDLIPGLSSWNGG